MQYKEGDKSFINHPKYCKGCGLCIEFCPKKCLEFTDTERGVYGNDTIKCDISKCIQCKICERICPDGAIKIGS
ncbi:MAG: 4Fe-4S binding protein [Patescibacteria group bacterium]|nr:4Fe-4S binding protein [Patescibacteria group bacterium]